MKEEIDEIEDEVEEKDVREWVREGGVVDWIDRCRKRSRETLLLDQSIKLSSPSTSSSSIEDQDENDDLVGISLEIAFPLRERVKENRDEDEEEVEADGR